MRSSEGHLLAVLVEVAVAPSFKLGPPVDGEEATCTIDDWKVVLMN
jgi:hypothetical protein